jgi:hypothetical protein
MMLILGVKQREEWDSTVPVQDQCLALGYLGGST